MGDDSYQAPESLTMFPIRSIYALRVVRFELLAAHRHIAVEVQYLACRHLAQFLASDLLPIMKTVNFAEFRFSCAHFQSDQCRAYPRGITSNEERIVIYRPWPR